MSGSANENSLKQRNYFLVLRLTLDQRGRLLQGTLVDMTNTLRHRLGRLFLYGFQRSDIPIEMQ